MNQLPLPPFELRYLYYFVAVAEELSFRKAAQRLHVSSPALSIRVRHLEDVFGVRLFERNTGGVRLTAHGEMLLTESRKLLQNINDLTRRIQESAEAGQGRLRIDIPGRFSRDFMSRALNLYHARFPKVDVTLMDLPENKEPSQALKEGRIDIGFAPDYLLRGMVKNTDHLLVMDVPICAVMAAQHPLAAKKEVTLEELAAYPILGFKPYGMQAGYLLAIFQKKKLEPKMVMTDSIEASIAMMAAMNGVALWSKLRQMPHHPEFVLRPVKGVSGLRLRLHAVWNRDGAPPQVLDFVGVLREIGALRERE